MEINIKLKFLEEEKGNKSIEVVRLQTKQAKEDSLRNYLSKRRTINLPNQTHEDLQPELYNMQSFREHREKSITYSKDTPRQALTHRYSKSKQIKLSKSKKMSRQEDPRNKTILFKKKKDTPSGQIKKNISELLTKPNDRSRRQPQSRANFVEDTFTGKFQGLDGKKVLKQHSQHLSEIQKVEIINEKEVYYIGLKNKTTGGGNEDDLEGNYLWNKHDHIGFRYELIERLGSGSFGDVVKAYDHKNKEYVAVKIIKSKRQHFQLALNEINILMLIKENDLQSEKNCVKIKDFIVFRKHMCIVFELLSLSLYELLKLNEFEGIRMDFIRRFAIQLLNALAFLKKLKIIHSDIKPQNVLLKSKSKTGIKLIDFGTSMHSHQTSFDYIQSRYYRAPQVITGHPYCQSIDMWSTGCVLAELYLGLPLFAGDNQQQQLSLILQAIGVPSHEYLKNCSKCSNFFHSNLSPKIIKTTDGKVLLPDSKPLQQRIADQGFLDFLLRIFVWDIDRRLTPLEALMHPWILQGLPEDIKKQHVFYIKEEIKKETVATQEEAPATSRRKRVKRNSELCQSSKKDKKHFRRRSDGMA